jgi:large subunit ribosomal protein L28
MSRECIITGKKPRVGYNVSHSNNKTKRRFDINLQTKKFFIPETGEWITLRLTARAIKTISKKGISEVLKDLKKQGYELI